MCVARVVGRAHMAAPRVRADVAESARVWSRVVRTYFDSSLYTRVYLGVYRIYTRELSPNYALPLYNTVSKEHR